MFAAKAEIVQQCLFGECHSTFAAKVKIMQQYSCDELYSSLWFAFIIASYLLSFFFHLSFHCFFTLVFIIFLYFFSSLLFIHLHFFFLSHNFTAVSLLQTTSFSFFSRTIILHLLYLLLHSSTQWQIDHKVSFHCNQHHSCQSLSQHFSSYTMAGSLKVCHYCDSGFFSSHLCSMPISSPSFEIKSIKLSK